MIIWWARTRTREYNCQTYAKSECLIELSLPKVMRLCAKAEKLIELQKLLNWNGCKVAHNLSSYSLTYRATSIQLNQTQTNLDCDDFNCSIVVWNSPILRITRYLPPIIISERLSFNSRIFSILIELWLRSIRGGRSFCRWGDNKYNVAWFCWGRCCCCFFSPFLPLLFRLLLFSLRLKSSRD